MPVDFLNFKEEKTPLLLFKELPYYFYFVTRSEYKRRVATYQERFTLLL